MTGTCGYGYGSAEGEEAGEEEGEGEGGEEAEAEAEGEAAAGAVRAPPARREGLEEVWLRRCPWRGEAAMGCCEWRSAVTAAEAECGRRADAERARPPMHR